MVYETFHELEEFWTEAADVLDGTVTTGSDGQPVSHEDALEWLNDCLCSIDAEPIEKAIKVAAFIKNLNAIKAILTLAKNRSEQRQLGIDRAIDCTVDYLHCIIGPGVRLEGKDLSISWVVGDPPDSEPRMVIH